MNEGRRKVVIGVFWMSKNIIIEMQESEFALVRFQPKQVLFLHRPTRKTYRYYENPPTSPTLATSPTLEHPHLLRSRPYNSGVLFLQQQSSLAVELANRSRGHLPHPFSEQQIVNTFLPLFDCLLYLKSVGQPHLRVHSGNVVVINGTVKLRDWNGPGTGEEEGLVGLGVVMVGCLIGREVKADEMQGAIVGVKEKYSKGLITALLVLARKLESQYKNIPTLLTNTYDDPELVALFEQISAPKQKRLIHFSPAKKFSLGVRRLPTQDNIQNKLENGKIEKRILEMNKRHEEGKGKTPVLNLSNGGAENLSRWQRSPRLGRPASRHK